jgi:hypothetical protein
MWMPHRREVLQQVPNLGVIRESRATAAAYAAANRWNPTPAQRAAIKADLQGVTRIAVLTAGKNVQRTKRSKA